MPFVVQDLQDLVRLLEQHPEWKGLLRASLLGDDLLRLPAAMRELAEAQERTERRVEELAEAQRRTEQTLARLTSEVEGLKVDVGDLKGDSLERRYRERAASYFQRLLRRIRVLDHQQTGVLLDDAVEAGRITPEERADALEADVLISGLRDGEQVYLVAEVSAVVDSRDVERAARRSGVVARGLGAKVLPAVAGQRLSSDAGEQARKSGVLVVADGAVQSAS
jgi:hypothetical protein